ncbi:MAG: PAS domain-containing protein, partial [Leptolyngbyaceae bacterium]|nr:PAS domain-containing protein [Leptolyngbyaceae bacterium]
CHYDIFPEIGDEWKAIHQKCLQGVTERREEEAFPRADGRTDWLKWEVCPWYTDSGAVGGLVMFTEVITWRKEAELALAKANEALMAHNVGLATALEQRNQEVSDLKDLYEQVLDAIPDMILCKGPESKLLFGNKAFRDYYGMTNDQLRGLIDAPHSKPDYTQQYVKDDAYVFNTGQHLQVEELAVRHDGEERLFLTTKTPIFSEMGKVVQTVGISRDITEQKRTQTQIIQAEKMSSLGQLVAGVAHEINNPVNFIYGNLDHANDYADELLAVIRLYQETFPEPGAALDSMMAEIDLDFLIDDLPKLLQSMKVGANRIREIVSSLRNFSRMDEAEIKDADLHEGIDSTLMILQHRLKKQSDRPEILVQRQYGNLPMVECFPGQLNQVFMNILSNGIDALEEALANQTVEQPVITINTSLLADQSVRIAITDNGPGMSQTVCDRIFDPFFTTKAVGKGTGMGLAISYQVVTEKHGGTLTCHSTMGEGTEFVIIVPRR